MQIDHEEFLVRSQSDGVVAVIPAGTIQINSQGEAVQGLHTITMTNATTAGGLVQYTSGQDGPFYVPGEDGQLATIGRDTLSFGQDTAGPHLALGTEFFFFYQASLPYNKTGSLKKSFE